MNAQHRINKLENKLRKIDKRIAWLLNATKPEQQIELQRLRQQFIATFQRKQALTGN